MDLNPSRVIPKLANAATAPPKGLDATLAMAPIREADVELPPPLPIDSMAMPPSDNVYKEALVAVRNHFEDSLRHMAPMNPLWQIASESIKRGSECEDLDARRQIFQGGLLKISHEITNVWGSKAKGNPVLEIAQNALDATSELLASRSQA